MQRSRFHRTAPASAPDGVIPIARLVVSTVVALGAFAAPMHGLRAQAATPPAAAPSPVAPTSVAQPAADQPAAADHLALGDRESRARRPAAAFQHYEAAIALSPARYDALWRASREAVDLGETEKNEAKRARLNEQATAYARRAVAANPAGADGYFQLARSLGRTALSVSARERVKYATDIRTNAMRALELQPQHAGALHIMGVWNAEVMRLNGIARAVAKKFLGAGVFGSASWANATRYMEQSVAADPVRLIHHLDLARVYRDTKRRQEARTAYESALRAPMLDANDDVYRRAAESELRALK